MSCSNSAFGLSRRKVARATRCSWSVQRISSPRNSSAWRTLPGNDASSWSTNSLWAGFIAGSIIVSLQPSRCRGLGTEGSSASALDDVLTLNLLLKLQHAVQQGLGRRWAARDIDVDRHDPVAAAHHGVGVVVVAAA